MPRRRIADQQSPAAHPRYSCEVVRSTEPLDLDAWVSRYVLHVVALYETIQHKEAA